MAHDRAVQLRALARPAGTGRRDAGAGREGFDQRVGDQEAAARLVGDQHVIHVRAIGERLVDRDRPGRRRPDHRMGADQIGCVRGLDDLERHVDLGRHDILIFDLGLGQRGLLDRDHITGLAPR